MSAFFLRIATPEKDAYSGEVEYLSVSTPCGRAGFMAGALPSVGVLKSGRVDIKSGDGAQTFMCGDGIFRVAKDGVTVITSRCVFDGEDEIEQPADGGRSVDYAKAKIASSILGVKDKNKIDD